MVWGFKLFKNERKNLRDELKSIDHKFNDSLHSLNVVAKQLQREEKRFKKLWKKTNGASVLGVHEAHELRLIEDETYSLVDKLVIACKHLDSEAIELAGSVMSYADFTNKSKSESEKRIERFEHDADEWDGMLKSDISKQKKKIRDARELREKAA
ncbi:hypothetical protein HOK51_06285 [Candidatus Woesearchaeota archaeon]|jgi:hypothetical protein|nr:hypothetical protein [Candidatus Woesearchaeota archaeon]MBT6519434.1 hypothetical protein [Candidatus Woesearchaeota archaeon]MBT7368905.1 hypothetical protein [Candidatus Woesearchaeota archaeon]